MKLDENQWEKVKECCQDKAAFEQLQQLLNLQLDNSGSSISSSYNSAHVERVEHERAWFTVMSCILKSRNLDVILKVTTTKIREFLNADRVTIFQFYPEFSYNQGEFIAEDVRPSFNSVLAVPQMNYAFELPFLKQYKKGKVHIISDIYEAELSDDHLKRLAQFQVRSKFIVPLLVGQKLWGLLCIHQCTHLRQWQPDEIEFVTQISEYLGVALQQAELLTQARSQIEQRKALADVIAGIRDPLDLEKIFSYTVTNVRELLNVDRVAIFRFNPESYYNEGEFISEDVLTGLDSVLASKVYAYCFGELFSTQEKLDEIQEIADIYEADLSPSQILTLRQFQVRANLVVPLKKENKIWGLLCLHQCSSPRKWENSEIEFVTQISQNLGVALRQVEYVEQVQTQATQLAIAQERDKEAERQQILYTIVNRIRQSLDIQIIFNTSTDEVRHFLKADRVAVYRFNPDWSGDFVAESFAKGWQPLVGVMPSIKDTFLQDNQGGRYRLGETFAVDNIYTVGHQDCHIQLLEQFQAKAYIVVPILQGENLWGLLAAYQNFEPRHWQDYEIQLLAQIGIQLGVALKQGELLAETQELAEYLRQTQLQLVQTEKMSSLGQMIAGIAHEINNPVNFIYGNLNPANEYIQDILTLIQLYQQEYPKPNSVIQEHLEAIELDFIVEDLKNILSSMRMGAERIYNIVLSLRNFSRLDEAEVKAVDIHEGIESTLIILKNRFKATSERPAIEIIKNYGKLPKVQCYVAQLNQVFMNILSNAVDAFELDANASQSSSNFRITIETSEFNTKEKDTENWVLISIRDNGPGISQSALSKIFDPFFTTKPVGKGTGLGLSISYQIVVEKHQGVIECHSKVGQGTEFRIKIPIIQLR